jgi:hypothetical protein
MYFLAVHLQFYVESYSFVFSLCLLEFSSLDSSVLMGVGCSYFLEDNSMIPVVIAQRRASNPWTINYI